MGIRPSPRSGLTPPHSSHLPQVGARKSPTFWSLWPPSALGSRHASLAVARGDLLLRRRPSPRSGLAFAEGCWLASAPPKMTFFRVRRR